jgi:hypothetical protein
MKIANISYDDFNDSALTAFAVYNASLKSISSVTDGEIFGDAFLTFSTMAANNSQICSTFMESDNLTVPVLEDYCGRKFIQPIDTNKQRHDIYLLNPSVTYGI